MFNRYHFKGLCYLVCYPIPTKHLLSQFIYACQLQLNYMSMALALEIPQSCTKPSMSSHPHYTPLPPIYPCPPSTAALHAPSVLRPRPPAVPSLAAPPAYSSGHTAVTWAPSSSVNSLHLATPSWTADCCSETLVAVSGHWVSPQTAPILAPGTEISHMFWFKYTFKGNLH